jgi:hypothetical protein
MQATAATETRAVTRLRRWPVGGVAASTPMGAGEAGVLGDGLITLIQMVLGWPALVVEEWGIA